MQPYYQTKVNSTAILLCLTKAKLGNHILFIQASNFLGTRTGILCIKGQENCSIQGLWNYLFWAGEQGPCLAHRKRCRSNISESSVYTRLTVLRKDPEFLLGSENETNFAKMDLW